MSRRCACAPRSTSRISGASASARRCSCAPARFGREFKGRVSSIARVVGLSRINSGDPRKFSDVDVLKVLVELPNPGLLVVGEQVDVYFKSDRSDKVETQ